MSTPAPPTPEQAADAFQRFLYESLAHLGPLWSALGAGFAVIVGGKVLLTPAGNRYLSCRAGIKSQLRRAA